MITHDMDLVYEYSTRVIVMEKGMVAYDGGKEELFKEEYKKYHLTKPTILKTIDYINGNTKYNIESLMIGFRADALPIRLSIRTSISFTLGVLLLP